MEFGFDGREVTKDRRPTDQMTTDQMTTDQNDDQHESVHDPLHTTYGRVVMQRWIRLTYVGFEKETINGTTNRLTQPT